MSIDHFRRPHPAGVAATSGTARRVIALTAGLAAAVGGLVVLAAPAHASPPASALVRCRAGDAPDARQEFVQDSRSTTASYPPIGNPPNGLFPGDVVRVTITGRVQYDASGDTTGAQGIGVTAPSGFPFVGLKEYSSVALWNNNPGGWIGAPVATSSLNRCTAAPTAAPARLLFQMNDPSLSDNLDGWKIQVDVFRATPAVTVTGVQVTQGIQTVTNDVPLIADKRTFVRVMVRNTDPAVPTVGNVRAGMVVNDESTSYSPVNRSTVTSTSAGSRPQNLTSNFLFELDPAAVAAGTRWLTIAVTSPSGPVAHYLLPVTFHAAGPAEQLNIIGARYSYSNVPPAMQQQVGLTSSFWPARPTSTWTQQQLTAENALPVAHLAITDLAPTSADGSTTIDCGAVEDASGTWGCANYTAGRAWAESTVDRMCPGGGCWIAVLQPEIDFGHHGAHYVDGLGNHVINLQGESSPTEQGLTLAHEIGHGFGLAHTWEDPTYPRSDGGLGPFVAVRDTPAFSTVVGTSASGATTAYDLMSYSSPAWFSPHNYCAALAVSSGGTIACPAGFIG